jgi:sec-independent protein translocase protein TatC
MSTSRDNHPDPDDFFADTRMSFGEHIEDLRTHLIRALTGFAVALFASFFVGHLVLEFISAPIDRELEEYYNRRLDRAKQKYLAEAEERGDLNPREEMHKVPRKYLEGIFGRRVEKGPWLTDDGKYVQVPFVTDARAGIDEWIKNHKLFTPRPTLRSFTIMEPVLVWFKVCLVTALVLGSPWIFYQVWSFIAAGLYPQEKRLVNRYLPFAILLFFAGVCLCQFVVMPQTISALLAFNEWLGVEPELRLNDWLTFALLMPVLFGICFQTPLAMLMLERVGLATVETYKQKWRIVLFLIAVAYVIVSPTPDPWTMVLFLVPMYGLYGLGILLCKLSPRQPLSDLDAAESEEMVEV